ncbi:hypothetical protein FJY63_14545, partial [Candidatus Sumerlaeota bacterium]|nr:hypothetical protein [Candidatus Sumerlaeota bacterium]
MEKQNKGRLQILAVVGLLAIAAASCITTSPESAFKQAERIQTADAFERFARNYSQSPFAAEARKRAAELREKRGMGSLDDLLRKATKASQLERFIADHPRDPKLVLMAKFRIVEFDYQDVETKNPFRPTRPGNVSWEKFVSHYAFGEYLTLPDDPEMRKMYYDRVHTLLIRALARVDSYEAWMRYLSTYPDSPYFQQAAEQVEKVVLANADKWEGYDLLKNYLDFYDLKLNRPCPNRKSLERKFQQGLADAAVKEDTKQAYQRYLHAFPDSPDNDTIVLHKDNIEFAEARAHGDRARIGELIERYKGNKVDLAQSIVHQGKVYLEQMDFDEATRSASPRSLQDFIDQYTNKDE